MLAKAVRLRVNQLLRSLQEGEGALQLRGGEGGEGGEGAAPAEGVKVAKAVKVANQPPLERRH